MSNVSRWLSEPNQEYLFERNISPEKWEAATGTKLSQWLSNWEGRPSLADDWRGTENERDLEKRLFHRDSPGMHPAPIHGLELKYPACLDGIPRVRARYAGQGPWSWTPKASNFEEDLPRSHWTNEAVTTDRRWQAQKKVPSVPWFGALDESDFEKPGTFIIVEAPIKAMAVTQLGLAKAIGMAGADAGLHDPDRPSVLNREAARAPWRDSIVYVMMDSGQLRNPSVAHGLGRTVSLISREGATVRVCYLPEADPKDRPNEAKSYDQGPDDYLAQVYHQAWIQNEDPEAAWDAARAELQRLLDASVPGPCRARVEATPDDRLPLLLDDLPFLGTFEFAGPDERKWVARKLGRSVREILGSLSEKKDHYSSEKEKSEEVSYEVREGALYCGDLRLASFSARISEEVTRDDGQSLSIHYRLQGSLESGALLPEIEVEAEAYRKMEWLSKWTSKAYLEAGKLVQEHARTAIQKLSAPKTRTVYSATGWREIAGKHVYVLPGGGIGPDGPVEVECEVEARYRLPALSDAREALRASLSLIQLAPREVMGPLLGMLYLAPLRPLLPHGVDFTLWLHGQTGAMKSSIAGVVQSHFGEFSHTHLPGSWEDTITTIEKSASVYADVIYTVDNLVPPKTMIDQKSMVSKVGRFLQMVGDGQSRGRQTADLKDRQRYRPRAAVISTAETLPPADNESTFGRTLCVALSRGEVDVAHLTYLQSPEAKAKLQAALGGYVQWIAGLDWDSKRRELHATLEHFREVGRGCFHGHPRLPGNIALLKIGLAGLKEYAEHLGMGDEMDSVYQEANAGLYATGGQDQPSVEAATAVDQWLSALQAMLRSRTVCLASSTASGLAPERDDGRTVPCIGWRDGEEVLLDPEVSYREVERFLGDRWRYSQTELHRQLLDAETEVDGHAEPVSVLSRFDVNGGKRRVKRKATVGGGRMQVLTLRRIVLGVVHEDGLRAVRDAISDEDLANI